MKKNKKAVELTRKELAEIVEALVEVNGYSELALRLFCQSLPRTKDGDFTAEGERALKRFNAGVSAYYNKQ